MTSHAVVTPHHLSADAARQVLERGGNAVDAAVAAVAAQGVVAPETCGVGGDLFALVHLPGEARPRALNSSGRSGSNAAPDPLREAGSVEIPGADPTAVTIPGCVDGMESLVTDLGRHSLSDVLRPAIDLALNGFEVSTEQAAAFSHRAPVYADNPAVSDFFRDGRLVQRGDNVTRGDLARTLSEVADGGRAAFYEGVPGEDISEAVGGLVTSEDLAVIQADWVDPIGIDVAGFTAWTIPPNSQGYLGHGALAVFEMLDPPDDPADPLWWHLLIEAYRCLAWERNDLVSDPKTLSLPAHFLLDHERLERAAGSVDHEKTGVWPRVGEVSGTAYLCVADAEGMAVSIIQSNYRGLGSPFGAARSGFLLQDRGMGFSLMPGHPNELGPRKRPLHTLSPTLWSDGDRPSWLLGTRGGAVQPQLVAQVAARAILGEVSLEESQDAPRWTASDFGPDSGSCLDTEPDVPDVVVDDLRSKGHVITEMDGRQPGWGPVSIIDLTGPEPRAAADPRVDTTTALVFGTVL